MQFDYYKAPSDEVFNEIKEKAIQIWNTYDNEFGYVDEKVDRIKDIENFKDNVWFIVGMFDMQNQYKLLALLEGEAKDILHNFLIYAYRSGK